VPKLREQILNMVCDADGVRPADANLTAQDVVLTTGSQQLLYLLGEALFDPGDIVICEAPSYFATTRAPDARRPHALRADGRRRHGRGRARSAARAGERSGEIAKLKLIYTVDTSEREADARRGAPAAPRRTRPALREAATAI
jgi:2-aminoadipate transaminase